MGETATAAVARINAELHDAVRRGWMLAATAARVMAANERTARGEIERSAFAPFPGGAWRLIQTGPGLERRFAELMQQRGGVVYLPLETYWAGVGSRRREHARPLIRGYVFVLLPDAAIYYLREVQGFMRVVTHCGRIGVVDTDFIYELHAHQLTGGFDCTLTENGRAARRARLSKGDVVRVTAGKYRGWIGRVVGLKGDRRAKLVIDMFGKIAQPEVDVGALDIAAP